MGAQALKIVRGSEYEKDPNALEILNGREVVRGTTALAAHLRVNRATVYRWMMAGYLDDALMIDTGRLKVFDVKKVFECIHPSRMQPKKSEERYLRRKYKY